MTAPFVSVIDDDDGTRHALIALMRAKGLRVAGFESAERFLEADICDECGCIVTDIHMPGLTGIQLKEKLTSIACDTPVIMITARTEDRLQTLAMASGAFGFLRKPFKSDALIAYVERALANS